MASAAWKSIERTVARLVGGDRTWNSSDSIDVIEKETGYAIEVKNVTAPTVADLERWLVHNQPKADRRGLKSALVVKRRAGRGKRSPYLAVFELTEPIADENGTGN